MPAGCPCCDNATRCDCGMMSNDPYHERWCGLLRWNAAAEQRARDKADAEFAKRLEVHEARFGRPDDGPAQTGLDVGSGASPAFQANPKAKGRK